MADVKLSYPASSAITLSLASLASSASWLAGRESTLVDNTTNKYLDYKLAGKITVGTTPTINTEIRVYVLSMLNDASWPGGFTGVDSARTASSAGSIGSAWQLARVLAVDATTSDLAYNFDVGSVAQLYGGVCPRKFLVFVSHNTVAALHATAGNHVLDISPVFQTVT